MYPNTVQALTCILLMSAAVFTANQTAAQKPAAANQHSIILPTGNKHIFRGDSENFYMFVYRQFEGVSSKPWTAGKYGFVRNIKRTEDGLIGTRFHEGIDIKPLNRDRSNRPLDKIMAIAAGTVAYTNTSPTRSNYGKYIVIEHHWSCGPIYSLYAHLSKLSVQQGQQVNQGQTIGQMGYTGSGLNRERSHLHLELNLMVNKQFNEWHIKHRLGKNYHGMHNGMNMVGLDIAAFYIAQRRDNSLTIPRFVKSQQVYYKVTIPRTGIEKTTDILARYPWLNHDAESSKSPSWEISLTASGFPVSILPSQRIVDSPRISSVKKCQSKHSYHTKGLLLGTGYRASLSDRGKRFIELLTGSF